MSFLIRISQPKASSIWRWLEPSLRTMMSRSCRRFLWKSVGSLVRRLMVAHRPDAVLGYWAHPDGEVAVRSARLVGVPVAVMVGGSDVLVIGRDRSRGQRILDVLHRADAALAVSRD